MIKYHLDKTLLRTNTVGIIINVLEKCLTGQIKGDVKEEINYILNQRQIAFDTTKHMRVVSSSKTKALMSGGKK